MTILSNKKYQYLFFSILSIYVFFNGGNSNLSIQLNFILLSFFFLKCLKYKNYNLHLKNFLIQNKKSLILYVFFLLFLCIQIIPLPFDLLKFFAIEKFKYIEILNSDIISSSISFSPSESFFQILHYISILLVLLITKMILYTERHKRRFFLFLSFVGFLSSVFAVILYLNGNPDLLFFKSQFYKTSSTGFFINRTVFAIFLLFSLISSLELLKNLNENKIKSKNDNFFLKIYIRLFLVFITIGIITSFSRIGNFLLLVTIIFYFADEFFFKKNKNKSFLIIISLIIIFDILILGFYFGASQVIDRFYFLNEELRSINQSNISFSRLEIILFSFKQINNFLIFGYGSGSYETMFQLKFINPDNKFANHAHSDLLEFLGEFGLIGFSLLFLSIIKFFTIKKNYNFINSILFCYLFILLLFDFSFHIPIIQVIFVIIFSVSSIKTTQLN